MSTGYKKKRKAEDRIKWTIFTVKGCKTYILFLKVLKMNCGTVKLVDTTKLLIIIDSTKLLMMMIQRIVKCVSGFFQNGNNGFTIVIGSTFELSSDATLKFNKFYEI